METALEERLLLAGRLIVGVFAKISKLAGSRDAGDHLWAAQPGQLVELDPQGLETLGSEMRRLHGRARNDRLGRASHDELLDGRGSGRRHRLGECLAGCCPGPSGLCQRCRSRGAAPYGRAAPLHVCLLYTSDAADEEDSVDLGGRRIIKKKK